MIKREHCEWCAGCGHDYYGTPCEHCVALPEPPPMRIGLNGDTIDRHGVRRKANGKIRTVCTETIVNWFAIACFVSAMCGFWIGAR